MIHVKAVAILVMVLVISVSFGAVLVRPSTPTLVTYLSAQDFQKESLVTKNMLLIDVRTPEEFSSGHIHGAIVINIRQEDFSTQISKLNHQQNILIYCRSGHRTEAARAEFEKQGFKKLVILKGGIQAWNAAQLPLE